MLKIIRFLFIPVFLSIPALSIGSNIYYDSSGSNLKELLNKKGSKIVLRNVHSFVDTIRVAENCEINFAGGRISGPIIFNNTKLSGDVNLKGSTISGKIKNRVFNASWLCYRDGEHDDSGNINSIIGVCNNVFFPKGTYRLIAEFKPQNFIDNKLLGSIMSHIGISANNISLKGEDGTVFYTKEKLGILCVYSQPYKIEESVKNISISNIGFVTENDGSTFLQWTHAIKLLGVNSITISNCIINDFWGDAICLSHYGDTPKTGERTRNQNVKIINNEIVGANHFNNRNGISVISGKNVLIKGNRIINVSQDKMPGGIDVEPNNSAYTIENIRIENNTLDSIHGGGGAINVVVRRNASAKKIIISNNNISNSRRGVRVWIDTKETTENLQITNNNIDRNTIPYMFVGEGSSKQWIIQGNCFERPCKQEIPGDISVKNIVIKNQKKKKRSSG